MAAALVPELTVSDLDASLSVYTGLLGFEVRYARPVERFAYLVLGQAELMLEEPVGRVWLAGPLARPYGRGINLQIACEDVAALHDRVLAAGMPLLQPLEQRRYLRLDDEIEVRQFVMADPDGYLLRFQQVIGTHPCTR